MKRYALVLSLALVLVLLVAGLAWPQAIQVREFDNIDYSGQSILTHDGCLLITWRENFEGRLEQFFQLYDDQFNPLWPENLHIFLPHGIYGMVETSDAGFVIVFFNMTTKAIKISREGSLPWGEEGVEIFFRRTDGLSVAADLNGGVYLAWAGSSNYQKPVTVQHLSSDGSLSMAENGVSLDTDNSHATSLLVRPDNSVVVAWALGYGVRVNVVNSSGDLLWDQTMVIPSTDSYPYVALNTFGGDTFALFFVSEGGLQLQRFNSSGAALWAEPVRPLGELSVKKPMKTKLMSDNSVLVFAHRSSPSGDAGHYLQKIGADGSLQYPSFILFQDWLGNIESFSDIIALEQGACAIAFSSYLEFTDPKDINLVKIDNSGAVSVRPVTQSSSKDTKCSAYLGDGGIRILWQHWATGECGIYTQILDSELNPILEEGGEPFRVGSNGMIDRVKLLANEAGCAVVWEQADNHYHAFQCYLQIYNKWGQPLYGPQGLRINRPGSRIWEFQEIRSNGSDFLLLWHERTDDTYSARIQIVNEQGQVQFAEGGIEIISGSDDVEPIYATSHQGDWYLLWKIENNVMGQKIRGNQFLWGDGLQLTQAHPDYPGFVHSFSLQMPWLFWKIDYDQFCKRIDAEGITQHGFPEYGKLIDMPSPGSPFSQSFSSLTVCGDHFHIFRIYCDLSIPDMYELNLCQHSFFGADSERLFDPVVVDDANAIYFRNGYLWMTRGYNDHYQIRKYDIFGNELFNQSVPVYGISSFSLPYWDFLGSNDEHLVVTVNGGFTQHFYVTPEMQLLVPVDRIIFENLQYPILSFGGDRAWVSWKDGPAPSPGYYTGIKLQCLVREPLPNPDEELPLPDMPCFISCSPNPFNPRVNISFSIPIQGNTKLGVYDLRGRKIRVLLDEDLAAAEHRVSWDGKDDAGRDSASGVYFLKLENGGLSSNRKITLLK